MTGERVLVVDDDRNFAKSMAILLRTRGYEVQVAHLGAEAVELFRNNDFDIAFIDVRMPGKSGVESFFEIRKFKPEAKVMMMTAYTVAQVLDQAIDAGALGVLHKPLELDKVVEAIEAAKPAGIVLIADDDPNFAESMRRLLTKQGYAVMVATTGREAIDTVLDNPVDLLILDLKMPVMNGLEVYLELKELGRLVPILIVTGYAVDEAKSIEMLNDMSVTGCLHKPFKPGQLIEAIEELLIKKI
jgi:two-component system response regulator HydG